MLHIWDLWLLKTNTNTHSRATNSTRCGNSHGAQGMNQRTTPRTRSTGPVPLHFAGERRRGAAARHKCGRGARREVHVEVCAQPAEYRGESAQSAIGACGAAPPRLCAAQLQLQLQLEWEGTGHGREGIEFSQVGGEWEREFKEGPGGRASRGTAGGGMGAGRPARRAAMAYCTPPPTCASSPPASRRSRGRRHKAEATSRRRCRRHWRRPKMDNSGADGALAAIRRGGRGTERGTSGRRRPYISSHGKRAQESARRASEKVLEAAGKKEDAGTWPPD
ncbi:hypothetical protein B0H14DRAFT_3587503 [Mycena olivaceomarginata]|nr:hypothetical protein B0H14DRAFT_3587503 [Mycena olivaceomarginata]